MTKIMDGKALAAKLRAELKEKVAALKDGGKEIGLAVVLIGDYQASKVYVRNKIKGCEEVGIRSYSFNLPASASQHDAENLVKELVASDNIHGILVQLPLPSHLDEQAILKLIPPAKDVDGFCAQNVGNLAMNRETIVACTPFGVMKLLEEYGVDPRGKNAVVLGRSNIVGKPMAMLLLNADATVTVCHSKTKNLKEVCAGADILVVAIGRAKFVTADGKPKFVTADMVKEGAVVIDVGMNRSESGKLCGDVDYENVKDKTSYITPVPGGVGPMTITMLLYNTYITAMRG